MKNARSIVMLVVALLAGLAAALLAARWIQEQSRVGADKVAVAMLEIQLGSRISPEVVSMVDWPSGNMPAGAFRDAKLLDGRVARTSMTRGEPILEGKLAPQGTQGGLSAVVGEGKRAITVRVNDVIGVAGFALPGNFVDIMVNTQAQGEGAQTNDKDRSISKIVLEHILVLAVAQEAGRDETKPKVVNAVTLEVTPDQAEKIDLARSVGTLSLVLRNQVDQVPTLTIGATKESLLGLPAQSAPAVAASAPTALEKAAPTHKTANKLARKSKAPSAAKSSAPPPRGDCVEVIRGTSRTTECF
ncbi:Flp pilus assembly protein CpaB [Uliginosibacterium gangwonense]|uniref:Flp pilus assembly protein CpaB n=1 Tax=Uliginosibacterium gangwonense TaxID=392736 RepID=UPI00037D60C5|nr:Flp pilus assembly protein CpaB [Uliginosibacterium gangwonense]